MINTLPTAEVRLIEIQPQQDEYPVCQKLMKYYREQWPSKSSLKKPYKLYTVVASELGVVNGFLLRDSHLVIPPNLQPDTLNKIYTRQQEITKCRIHIAQTIWWPDIAKDLENLISKCAICKVTTFKTIANLTITRPPITHGKRLLLIFLNGDNLVMS